MTDKKPTAKEQKVNTLLEQAARKFRSPSNPSQTTGAKLLHEAKQLIRGKRV